MQEDELLEKSIKESMQIIIFAGDARDYIMKALDKVGYSKYDEAKNLMQEANKKLLDAHRIQTKKIQIEAEGKKVEYSTLFSHAQDTLMTIMSEYKLTKKLIDIFEIKEGRLLNEK